MSEVDRRVAYALRIDGIDTVFVTDDELDDDWAADAGYVRSHAGLERPAALSMGIDPRGGDWQEQTITLRINDIDGTLPALFGGSLAGAPELVGTVEAHDDPAPSAVWGKCVGLETIGPAGERRLYSCFPGFAVGMRHVGGVEAWATGIGPAPVTDSPRLWTGRRWTVARVLREFGSWQALDDAQLVGFGVLLGQGTIDAESWEFRCAGIEGWTGGNLGAGAMADPIPVAPITVVGDGPFDGRISAALTLERLDGEEGSDDYQWVSPLAALDVTVAAGPVTYDDIVTEVQALLASVESDSSSGEAYTDGSDSNLAFATTPGSDGFTVQWHRDAEAAGGFDPATSSSRYAVRLRVTAHEAIWKALGYDPGSQPGVSPTDDAEIYCEFVPAYLTGHFVGSFWSAAPQGMLARLTGNFSTFAETDDISDYASNFQAPRAWPPIYRDGAVTWTLEAGQEFQLRTSNPVHLLGTLSRPVMGDPDDPLSPITISGGVGDANAQGVIVVDGPYRREGDKDGGQSPAEGYAFDVELERKLGRTQQVMRVAWRRSADGSMALDDEGYPRGVVYRVEDPRAWGFEFPPLHGPWSGWRQAPTGMRPMTARPLVAIEIGSDEGNPSSLLMRRILATTGSATTWFTDDTYTTPVYGTQHPAPRIEPGGNDKAAPVPLDAEVAALGLGVPADLIGDAAAWAAWDGVGEHVSRSMIVSAGSMSARATMAGMLSPAGLCWSFAGGKLGVLDPTRFPTPEQVSIIVTPDLYAGKAGDPSSARAKQTLREWAEIDRGEIQGTRDPVTGDWRTRVSRRSPDLGAAYRAQTIPHKINAPHAVGRASQVLGNGWLSECYQRFDATATFWSRPHFIVEVALHADDAADVWPGDGLMLTDPWLVDPSGTASDYGVTAAIGYVTRRSFSARDEVVHIRAILNAETALVLYAPAAVSTEYIDGDGGVYALVCDDDWLGCRVDGSLDVEGFGEPYWSATGAPALIEGFVWDGSTWSRGIFGEVDSIDATPGATRLVLTGALTGAAYMRDHHHVWVLRAYADQAASWVTDIFAALCDEDGEHDGEPGKTFRD